MFVRDPTCRCCVALLDSRLRVPVRNVVTMTRENDLKFCSILIITLAKMAVHLLVASGADILDKESDR